MMCNQQLLIEEIKEHAMKNINSKDKKHLLQAINIFGLDHLDPIILAALTSKDPLLLIGDHGTAKSELLNRIAAALKLQHRHYNASLINFDDLLGYPIPNSERTALEYLRTPADLWEAESVFFDELSRCRPEHQNRLFSIIHEKRIQGIALEHLSYRWAAMNPPPSLDDEDEEVSNIYQGSLPLDTALADRFAYIANIPALSDMSLEVRRKLIECGGNVPSEDGVLSTLIETTQNHEKELSHGISEWIIAYVNALINPLREANLAISGRRAVLLVRCIRYIHVACRTLDTECTLNRSAFLAIKWGLPHRAQGIRIRESVLNTIHKLALTIAGEPENSIWHVIRSESNAVRRIVIALKTNIDDIGKIEFSQLVSDAWANLTRPEQFILARNLLPVLTEDRLTSSTYELLLEPIGKVIGFAESKNHEFNIQRSRAGEWDNLLSAVNRLKKTKDKDNLDLGNVLYTLFAVEDERFDPQTLIEINEEWRELFAEAETTRLVA
ncbi:MAG TPA: hypothetical protein EYQ42_01325 [Thiotrichaceae bacterium]|nr:hypothetical protein [Thiotrichaceae bacterium]